MSEPIRWYRDSVEALVDPVWEEATAPGTVLVIERNAEDRARLLEQVERGGYRAEGADDLREGIFVADRLQPDVVVVAVGAGGWEPEWITRVLGALDATAGAALVGIVSDDVPADSLAAFHTVLPRHFARFRIHAAVSRALHDADRARFGGDLQVHELSLATPFPARFRIAGMPENRQTLHDLRMQLMERGVAAAEGEEDGDWVLSCVITVADAFALGFNEMAPDELRFALVDAFPEFGDPGKREALRRRIRDLEQLWGLRRPRLHANQR